MKSTLDTIAFFKSIRPTLESLSDEDAGALVKALFAHDDGEAPDISEKSAIVRAVFPLVAESVDRLTAKRMSKVRKQSANEPQEDSKQSANEPQNAAHNHNHNHNHSHSHNHNHPTDVGEEETPINGGKEENRKRFSPPTIEDVMDYCFEKGLDVDAHRFVDFYSSKGWMVGKNRMKDWKAACRNWAAKDRTDRKTKPKGNSWDDWKDV